MFLFRFIFYFFLVIFLLGLIFRLLLRFWVRRTFGKTPKPNSGGRTSASYTAPPKKKIIEKNEGDYIDYEEVK